MAEEEQHSSKRKKQQHNLRAKSKCVWISYEPTTLTERNFRCEHCAAAFVVPRVVVSQAWTSKRDFKVGSSSSSSSLLVKTLDTNADVLEQYANEEKNNV